MKTNYQNCILALMVVPFLISLACYGQVDSLVDTVAGKQEYQFQQQVEEQAIGDIQTLRQFIIDSLQLVFDEKLQELQDSMVNLYNNQLSDTLNKVADEMNQLDATIATLNDSLNILVEKSSLLEGVGAGYDLIFESKYFNYDNLQRGEVSKAKSGFFSSGGEDIAPFQVEELENYLERFFPEARCDSVQDFLTQLYIRQKDWANAELSLFKFIFLYPKSPLYEEVKTVRSQIFKTEKAYKNYTDQIMSIVLTTPAYPREDTRYYKFVDMLKDFPDPDIRSQFVKEARSFLDLYPFSSQSSTVCLWIGDYLSRNQQPQTAFIYYNRLMIFYPSSAEFPWALYYCANIQEQNFNEHQNAIDTYNQFIEKFPADTLCAYAHERIAKIADTDLKNWEQATNEYQLAADLFQQNSKPQNCIAALNRKAEILAKEMNLTQEGANAYLSIVTIYPESVDAPIALMAAGDLFNRYKMYESAITQYLAIYEKYPNADNVLDALEKTADIYYKTLKNKDKTVETLNLIINNYPGTKSSEKAAKLLSKVEKG
jgi:TolA-binding protein